MLERLEEYLCKDPFVPFRVILTSSSHYDVFSPLMVAVGRSEAVYFFPKSDRLAHLRLNQIASIETLESAAA